MKSVRIRSFSGSYFPTFGLNTVRYGEKADQKNSEYGQFSRSDEVKFQFVSSRFLFVGIDFPKYNAQRQRGIKSGEGGHGINL